MTKRNESVELPLTIIGEERTELGPVYFSALLWAQAQSRRARPRKRQGSGWESAEGRSVVLVWMPRKDGR